VNHKHLVQKHRKILANDLTPEDLLSLQDPLQQKVTICHIPNGDPSKAHDITVGASAVQAHLAHGDTVGPCVTGPPPTDTAKITVVKIVNGPNSPEEFTICVNTISSTGQSTPATPPCAPGSGSGFTYIVKAGEGIFYDEIPPPGTSYTSRPLTGDCNSVLEPGETRVCELVNSFTG
jgi:hypothetical protein